MLKFVARVTPGTDNEFVRFVCPGCGLSLTCHMFIPNVCDQCGRGLEDVMKLKQDKKLRLSYHRSSVGPPVKGVK